MSKGTQYGLHPLFKIDGLELLRGRTSQLLWFVSLLLITNLAIDFFVCGLRCICYLLSAECIDTARRFF